MNEIEKLCEECNTDTTQSVMGLVPEFFLVEEERYLQLGAWSNVCVCTDCGTLHRIEVTEEQIDGADRRYVRTLIEYGVISEDEGKEILGQ